LQKAHGKPTELQIKKSKNFSKIKKKGKKEKFRFYLTL
jgi:hypothetical protein